MRHVTALVLPAVVVLASCGHKAAPAASSHPNAAEVIATETELLRLKLTPEAQTRIGLKTVEVTSTSVPSTRQVAGEIVAPPSTPGGVPTGSTTNLQQIGSEQAAADGEVARAMAQARLAKITRDRAAGLVAAEAGSARARDEAEVALVLADAALLAAREQRELLGPAVAVLDQQELMWVRVSVFASDLSSVHRSAPVSVRALEAPRRRAPRSPCRRCLLQTRSPGRWICSMSCRMPITHTGTCLASDHRRRTNARGDSGTSGGDCSRSVTPD